MDSRITRRRFVGLLPAAVVGALSALRPVRTRAQAPQDWEHPDPRPDVDASSMPTAEDLADAPHVVSLFDEVRQIPHIVDGIRCHCGCADREGYRSLLSCYESPAMAKWCDICQAQGRLAFRRWEEGQTLDQIRRAIDARYAPGRSGRRHDHGRRHRSR